MERKKLLLFMSACAICGNWSYAQAQDKLVVHLDKDKPSREIPIAEIKRVVFSGDGISFIRDDSSQDSYKIDDVKQLTFSVALNGATPFFAEKSDLRLYPNPASEYISIAGWKAEESADAAIYSEDGCLQLIRRGWKGETIHIGSLAKGFYILKINNQSFKFNKL